MWGDKALRFGWFTTCWGSVVVVMGAPGVVGAGAVVAVVVVTADVVVVVARGAELPDAAAAGTIRMPRVAATATATFPGRRAQT